MKRKKLILYSLFLITNLIIAACASRQTGFGTEDDFKEKVVKVIESEHIVTSKFDSAFRLSNPINVTEKKWDTKTRSFSLKSKNTKGDWKEIQKYYRPNKQLKREEFYNQQNHLSKIIKYRKTNKTKEIIFDENSDKHLIIKYKNPNKKERTTKIKDKRLNKKFTLKEDPKTNRISYSSTEDYHHYAPYFIPEKYDLGIDSSHIELYVHPKHKYTNIKYVYDKKGNWIQKIYYNYDKADYLIRRQISYKNEDEKTLEFPESIPVEVTTDYHNKTTKLIYSNRLQNQKAPHTVELTKYNKNGQKISKTTYNHKGIIIRNSLYEYDSLGRNIQELNYTNTSVLFRTSNRKYSSTKRYYNHKGQVKQELIQHLDERKFESRDTLIFQEFRYNEMGHRIETKNKNYPFNKAIAKYDYSEDNRLVKKIQDSKLHKDIIRYSYHPNANLAETVTQRLDENKKVESTRIKKYDQEGKLLLHSFKTDDERFNFVEDYTYSIENKRDTLIIVNKQHAIE